MIEAFADPDIRRWSRHRIDDREEARDWVRSWEGRWRRGTDAAWRSRVPTAAVHAGTAAVI